jgi:hypothetical protein
MMEEMKSVNEKLDSLSNKYEYSKIRENIILMTENFEEALLEATNSKNLICHI